LLVFERQSLPLQETSSAADRIIDALDMALEDEERQREATYQPNLLMGGVSGNQHVLRTISDIRANDQEAALTTLPFLDSLKLLEMVPEWLEDASKVEQSVRVAVVLLKAHQIKLAASPSVRPVLAQLQQSMRARVQVSKNMMGFNLAGLQHLNAKARVTQGVPVVPPVKRKVAGM
jgi:U3 small nucleolar RNA-associated protein 12